MYATYLSLINFRNYKRQDVLFCPFVNIVIGQNAQGKTNLLESLYLCGVGKSPRTSKDKEMIMFGADAAQVKVTIQKKYGKDEVRIILDKNTNKKIAIRGMPITKIGELMGVVGVVFFSPDEMSIVKAAPADRRRFMDIALSQISKNYFYLLSRYNRIVAQRNKLLKSQFISEDALIPWDMQLCETAALIIKTRRGFIDQLSNFAAKEHAFLTENREELKLNYESVPGNTKEEIKENLLKEITLNRERDLRLGVTSVGPHKDDFGIFINQIDVRKFGSQGQQRTAALSLKLAEASLSNQEKGEPPILLLDDVMGELDPNRQRMLLKRINGLQSIITCTHLSSDLIDVLGEHKIIKIQNGVAK